MITAISEEPFLSQFLAFSCVFSFGSAFACLLKILLSSKKHEKKTSRFVFLCVFLSFTVILYTILIFAASSLSWPLDFSKNHSYYYLILAIIFATGTVISFFWKIALPVSLVLYVLLSFFTNYLMKSIFGEQRNMIPVHLEKNSPEKEIPIVYCPLPDTLALPVRRSWIFEGEKLPEQKNGILNFPPVKFYAEKVLLKNLKEAQIFRIPEPEVFPSLYSVHIDFKGSTLLCKVQKDL